jgi:hypothetical protein
MSVIKAAAVQISPVLYLAFRRFRGGSSGQKCPVLQGLDEFAQLRL